MADCMEICVKRDGCKLNRNIHSICKANNKESYDKLNKYFE